MRSSKPFARKNLAGHQRLEDLREQAVAPKSRPREMTHNLENLLQTHKPSIANYLRAILRAYNLVLKDSDSESAYRQRNLQSGS
jgi:cytochrome c peroxidase